MSVFLWRRRLPPIGPPSNTAGTPHSARAICLPPSIALRQRMPELTRRRDQEAREECWHIYCGDVRAGVIALRVGIPMMKTLRLVMRLLPPAVIRANARTEVLPPWNRLAPILRKPGAYFSRTKPRLILRSGARRGTGRRENTRCGMLASVYLPIIGTREALQHLHEMSLWRNLQQPSA
jgi:hypothetical protein